MTASDIINLILSVFTIGIATIALLQTHRQTKLSNKQRLFDRRLEQYHLINELLSFYKLERDFLKEKDIIEDVASIFILLNGSSRFASITGVMANPTGAIERINFSNMCQSLENSATEITLLWKEDFAKDFSEFIKQCVALFQALRSQQIIIKDLQETTKRLADHNRFDVPEEDKQRPHEWAKKNKLMETIEITDEIFTKIKTTDAEKKLKESLMLY